MALKFKNNISVLNSKFVAGKGSLEDVVSKLIDLVIYSYMLPAIVTSLISDTGLKNCRQIDLYITDYLNGLKDSKSVEELLNNASKRYSGYISTKSSRNNNVEDPVADDIQCGDNKLLTSVIDGKSFSENSTPNDITESFTNDLLVIKCTKTSQNHFKERNHLISSKEASGNFENNDQETELLTRLVLNLSNLSASDNFENLDNTDIPIFKPQIGIKNMMEMMSEDLEETRDSRHINTKESNERQEAPEEQEIMVDFEINEERMENSTEINIPENLITHPCLGDNETHITRDDFQEVDTNPNTIWTKHSPCSVLQDLALRENDLDLIQCCKPDEKTVATASIDAHRMLKSFPTDMSQNLRKNSDLQSEEQNAEFSVTLSKQIHDYSTTTMYIDSENSLNESTESTFNLETVGMFQSQMIRGGAIVTELQHFGTGDKLNLGAEKVMGSCDKQAIKHYEDENTVKRIVYDICDDVLMAPSHNVDINADKKAHNCGIIKRNKSVGTSRSVRTAQYLFIIPSLILLTYFSIILFRSWESVTKTQI